MEDTIQTPHAPDPLTPRQRRFVEEYLVDRNATAAYLRAGYRGTRETARRNASVLLTNPDVLAAVKQAEHDVLERVRFRQHEIYSEMRNVAQSNIDNYIVDDEGNVTLREGVEASAMRAVSSIQKKTTRRTHGEETETTHDVKITLWNKNDAVRMAAQTQGMLIDKIAPTTPDGKEEYSGLALSFEERVKRITALLAQSSKQGDPE